MPGMVERQGKTRRDDKESVEPGTPPYHSGIQNDTDTSPRARGMHPVSGTYAGPHPRPVFDASAPSRTLKPRYPEAPMRVARRRARGSSPATLAAQMGQQKPQITAKDDEAADVDEVDRPTGARREGISFPVRTMEEDSTRFGRPSFDQCERGKGEKVGSSQGTRERVYTKAGTYIHSRARHIQLTGGTLSECAARERIGGTFHSGNVPGLASTNLGKDTCLCSLRTPPLFLLPPPPLAPTSPPTRQKSAKMTTDGTDNSKHMAPTSCSLIRTRSWYVNLTSTTHVRRAMGRLLNSWIDAYITSSRTHFTFPTTNVLIFPR
ncbi:hypothetical protein B0H13DRAFT_2277925 [Mycena leptocephala]|nr:hypothetical protein B0H13DRAFT_2277925 [Mycena leptocephala]